LPRPAALPSDPATQTAPAEPLPVTLPPAPATPLPALRSVEPDRPDAPVPAAGYAGAMPAPAAELAKQDFAAQAKASRLGGKIPADGRDAFPSSLAEEKQRGLARQGALEEQAERLAQREAEGSDKRQAADANRAPITAHFRQQRLDTDNEGRAELEFRLPPAAGTYLLRVQGRGAGGIGNTEVRIVTELPEDR
jgi:hypothetical protein